LPEAVVLAPEAEEVPAEAPAELATEAAAAVTWLKIEAASEACDPVKVEVKDATNDPMRAVFERRAVGMAGIEGIEIPEGMVMVTPSITVTEPPSADTKLETALSADDAADSAAEVSDCARAAGVKKRSALARTVPLVNFMVH